MRDDRSFPAPNFSIKSKGCFATIYLYFCVKRLWWPKGKWGVFLLVSAENLVILNRVLLLPLNKPEIHPWEYSVWRTAGNKVQGKTTHYLLNHLVWDILPSLIPLKGLWALQNIYRGKQTTTENTSLNINFHQARWELINAVKGGWFKNSPKHVSHRNYNTCGICLFLFLFQFYFWILFCFVSCFSCMTSKIQLFMRCLFCFVLGWHFAQAWDHKTLTRAVLLASTRSPVLLAPKN